MNLQKSLNCDSSDISTGIESFTYGPYSSPEGFNKGFTHAFTMVFSSEEARDAYLPHEEHERVKQQILGEVSEALAFDYLL